ncbi:MAG: FAD:protein FMN transferase [Verrucomicrobiota bacterium]
MFPRLFLLILLGLWIPVAKAEENWNLYTFKQPHMGTEFTFRSWAKNGEGDALSQVAKRAFARVEELNQIASDYLPESEINDFARAPMGTPVDVSDDLFRLLDLSSQLTRETGGAFDATAGPFVRLWKIAKKNRRLPTDEQIASAQLRTGADLLEFDPLNRRITKRSQGMLFDLGGIGKGYAADEALEIFRESGFPRTLVAASGDIVVGDPPPGEEGWRIGVETFHLGVSPKEMNTVLLVNRAISTSGDTRRYFELDGVRYSHIVSTRTGLGLTERIAASVIAPNATTSDSYATAVTLLGEKEGLQFIRNKREIECQVVTFREGREVTVRTDGFTRFTEEKVEEEAPLPAP